VQPEEDNSGWLRLQRDGRAGFPGERVEGRQNKIAVDADDECVGGVGAGGFGI